MKVTRFSPRGFVAAVFVMAALAALSAGCETKEQAKLAGGSEHNKNGSATAADSGSTAGAATTSGAASREKFGAVSLSGLVKVTGTPPAPVQLDTAAKPECGKQRQALGLGELMAEKIVVGADGGLKDCIVYISKQKGLPRYYSKDMVAYGHPATVVLDQKGCQYIPHVFAVWKNQDVVIKNSDPYLHNVNIPLLNFNLSMSDVGEEKKPKFFKKASPHTCQCSVHPWMTAYAFVVETPFFSQTGVDGKFTIGKLPDADGTYTVEVWHEKDRKLKRPKAQKITVKDGALVEGNIVFEFIYKG